MLDKHISVGNHAYPVQYPDKRPICHHHGEMRVIETDEVVGRAARFGSEMMRHTTCGGGLLSI